MEETAMIDPRVNEEVGPRVLSIDEIKELFDQAKDSITIKMRASEKHALRTDTIIYFLEKYGDIPGVGEVDFHTMVTICDSVKKVMAEKRDEVSKITFDMFIDDGYEDPFTDCISYENPKVAKSIRVIVSDLVTFSEMRPYAEMLERLRYEIVENIKLLESKDDLDAKIDKLVDDGLVEEAAE